MPRFIRKLSAPACLLSALLLAPTTERAFASCSGWCQGQVGVDPLTSNAVGAYALSATSGTIGAGASAGAPVFSFRYAPSTTTNYAVVRRVEESIGNAGTGFTAGAGNCQLFAARSFSASDTGGTAATLTTNNGKLRTSLATTGVGDFRIANTGALSAGTRTLDATPLASQTFGVPTTAGQTLIGPGAALFDAKASQEPLILANNEGFVVQCTVPATGTWQISINVLFDEWSTY